MSIAISKRSFIRGLAVALVAGCMGLTAAPTQAVTIGFQAITANNVADAGIVESSVTVDITDAGSNHVSFLLAQAANGTTQPTVANLYFQDSSSLFTSIFAINNGTGVIWAVGSNPSDLPAGNSISPTFTATAALDSSANNPKPSKGVNPGEQVEVVLTLAQGKTFADVLAGIDDGSLRLGLHVINFASGASESFINHNNVPEPASMATAALGLGLIAFRRRKA